METQETVRKEYARPEGRVVKANMDRITMYGLYFVFVVITTLLHGYIWGFNDSHLNHYELGGTEIFQVYTPLWLVVVITCPVICLLIQYLLLYLFSGKDFRCLKISLSSWRVLVRKSLSLKYYRVALLFSFFLVGLLLIVHAFGLGDRMSHYAGLFCVFMGLADLDYYWTLRPFNGKDKIVDGKKAYAAIVLDNVN